MTTPDLTTELRDLLERAVQISDGGDDREVEVLLREGIEQPLEPEEVEQLLGRVLEKLEAGARERGDEEGARIVGEEAAGLIRQVVDVRQRVKAAKPGNGQIGKIPRLELEKHEGIEPRPVFPRPVFHEHGIDMWAGFVPLDSLQLWDDNERLAIHLEQFEREEGRKPGGQEILEIMTTRMRLPGVEVDDQFEIQELARSIASNGVRTPPVIGLDGTLYDGNRRVAACFTIRNSDEFSAEQKKRVNRIFVWQLTEFAGPADIDRLLMALNFEADLKKEWPTYVKARKVYEEWRTMVDLEQGSTSSRREAEMKRELSQRFALGPETTIVNRYIKMVEAANEFEDHHVDMRKRDRSEVRHHAAEHFEYFDELSKGVRVGGVAHSLGTDDELRQLVFDLLYEGKFAKWSDIRKLRYVPDNDDARAKLKEAQEMSIEEDDPTTIKAAQKRVGLALSIGEASASAKNGSADPNQKVRVFAEWLRSLPTSAFRDGEVTGETLERLLEAFGDAKRLSEPVLGAQQVLELSQ